MPVPRKRSTLERRLREIERERRQVRGRLHEVRRWVESTPEAAEWIANARAHRVEAPTAILAPPVAVGVLEMESAEFPEQAVALDFFPGPDDLDTKQVIMPRLQRTDLLRPPLGGHSLATRLVEPEHDRFRNYFGTTGLKRVREARRDRGSHRLRAIFMILMVLMLSYILFKMVT